MWSDLSAKRLLTQNSELRRVGVWNWTLPAHVVQLNDGKRFNTCPNAGACGRVCYAKMGTYLFGNVRARHILNLEYVLYGGDAWQEQMAGEIAHKRMRPTLKAHDLPFDADDLWLSDWIHSGGRAVRIHDAGDFFSLEYLGRWISLARSFPDVLFYAYTKEVTMVKSVVLPDNFRVAFSYGGKQDDAIDRLIDRHADVFPTLAELVGAGYFDQSDNDLLAVVAPSHKIGIVANNLPVAIRRFGGKKMSEI